MFVTAEKQKNKSMGKMTVIPCIVIFTKKKIYIFKDFMPRSPPRVSTPTPYREGRPLHPTKKKH